MQPATFPVPVHLRWLMGIAIVVGMIAVPVLHYRWQYTYAKRFREVTPGKFYRSGCLTAYGLEQAIKQYQIKTIINLMEEAPDPQLPRGYFDTRKVQESALCKRLGVKFVFLRVDTVSRQKVGEQRPETIDRFLAMIDNPKEYPQPVLLHCKAGLHRTGILSAVYQMEYEGYSRVQALHELREHGFGDSRSYADNDYIKQYIFAYQPGLRIPFANSKTATKEPDSTSSGTVPTIPTILP